MASENIDSTEFGSVELTFGKHKGKTLMEVNKIDRAYIRWLCDVPETVIRTLADTEGYQYLPDASAARHFIERAWETPIKTWMSKNPDNRDVASVWTMSSYSSEVWAAIDFMAECKSKKMCQRCLGRLMPIGHGRANGKDHADWAGREFHKACWFEEMEEIEDSPY